MPEIYPAEHSRTGRRPKATDSGLLLLVLGKILDFAPGWFKTGPLKTALEWLAHWPFSVFLFLGLVLVLWGRRMWLRDKWNRNLLGMRVPILIVVVLILGAFLGWDLKTETKPLLERPKLDDPWCSEEQALDFINWKITSGAMTYIPQIDLRWKLRDAVRDGLKARYESGVDSSGLVKWRPDALMTHDIGDSIFELWRYDGSTLENPYPGLAIGRRTYYSRDVWNWNW